MEQAKTYKHIRKNSHISANK